MSRWPLNKAYFWQTAPCFRIVLPLMIGIIGYDYDCPAAGYFKMPVVVCLLTGAATLILAGLKRFSTLLKGCFSVCLMLFFAAAGWCSYAISDTANAPDYYGRRMDTSCLQLVRVCEAPREGSATIRYTAVVLCDIGAHITCRSGKALLYVYRKAGKPSFGKGDTLLVPGAWQTLRNSGNPYEFDNARFQRRADVCYQQFLSPDELILYGKSRPDDSGFIDRVHGWCNKQLEAYIRNPASLGLLQAMLLGDESAFDQELRQAYAQTGVIHIVSISGSHVAVLFLVVTSLLFWIKGRRGAWIKYSTGVFLVWIYVLIAGAPPSAVRSAIMFSVIALGILSDREGQSLNTLLAAALILLLGKPAWLFTVGFQLSFGAVLSILVFYKPLCSIWKQTHWLGIKVWQAISVSIAAEILTAPLVVYYFHNFPLMFILANLLSGILVGFCALVGGMAILGLCWLPFLATLLGWLVSRLVILFNSIILTLQQVNPESFQYLQISLPELLLIYLLILGLTLWRMNEQKRAPLFALSLFAILLVCLNIDKYVALKQRRLVVFNNGKKPLVEMISGQYYNTLAGGSINSYSSRPAHTAWHSWRREVDTRQKDCFLLGNKKIFLVTDSSVNSYIHPFPLDILVIARPLARAPIGSLLRTFKPKEVVLAVRPTAWQLQTWTDSCRKEGVVFHDVTQEGAYIIE